MKMQGIKTRDGERDQKDPQSGESWMDSVLMLLKKELSTLWGRNNSFPVLVSNPAIPTHVYESLKRRVAELLRTDN